MEKHFPIKYVEFLYEIVIVSDDFKLTSGVRSRFCAHLQSKLSLRNKKFM